MRKLKNRELLILLVTVGVVLVFVVWQFAFKPLQGRDIDLEIRRQTAQVKKVQQMLAQHAMVQEGYRRLIEWIGFVTSEPAERSSLISKIETAARQNDVHISNMQPHRGRVEERVTFFPVEVGVSGTWSDISSFLSVLQSSPNYLFISELNLAKSTDSSGLISGTIILSRMRINKKM